MIMMAKAMINIISLQRDREMQLSDRIVSSLGWMVGGVQGAEESDFTDMFD